MKKLLFLAFAFCFCQVLIGQDIYKAIEDNDQSLVTQILKKNPDLLNAKNPPGQTPLWKAAEKGRLEIARALLILGADPAIGDNENTLPVHIAAKGGNTELFDLLLSKGFDINIKDDGGITPLFYAIESRDPNMVKHVIEKGGSVKSKTNREWPVMLYGVIFGPLETVQILIDNKADVNAKNENGWAPMHSAASFGRTDIAKLLFEKGADIHAESNDGTTPLMAALNPNCYDVAAFLISQGADVNHTGTGGNTAFINVAGRGTVSIAELLLKHGTDINAQNEFGQSALTVCAWSRNPDAMSKFLIINGVEINPKERTAYTPLHNAARQGHLALVENLVHSGAQVNRLDEDGYTPLNFAIINKNPDIVKYLVDHGAFLNMQDNVLGNTELHLAATRGCPEIVGFLLKNGADVTLKNNEGKTALDLAWFYGHKDIAYTLLSNGADDKQLASLVNTPDLLAQPIQQGEASVWFLGHSGWAVKTKNNFLIFDYFINPRTKAPQDSCLASGYIKPEELKDLKVTVFSSHSHNDHYSKEYFTWKETIPDIEYVMCFRPADTDADYTFIPIHEEQTVRDMKISTVKSTDLDGAFLVEVDGLVIFHSGDLANREEELMEAFTEEVDLVASNKLPVDILFAPIRGCGLGLPPHVKKGIEYMVEAIQPKVLVPMHAGDFTLEYKKFADELTITNHRTIMKWVSAKGDHFIYKDEKLASN